MPEKSRQLVRVCDHDVGAEVKVVLAEIRRFRDGDGNPAAYTVGPVCSSDVVGGVANERGDSWEREVPFRRV